MYSLNIGLTNRCNCRCSFCPVSRTKIKREDMTLDLALRIIDEAQIEHHVSLALFGESTLYPYLSEVISAIKRKNVESILYTNGLMDRNILNNLFELDKIIFSIDASDRHEYRKTKGVDGFDRVIENINIMMAKKNRPHVTAQFADLQYTDDLPDIIADKIKYGRFISWGGEIEWQSNSKQKIREKKPCTHIFKFLNVASNGDVVMCCLDYNHSVVLGNVKDQNVMDIWNGEKFNKLRQEQKNGIFNHLCLNCENESYYHPQ